MATTRKPKAAQEEQVPLARLSVPIGSVPMTPPATATEERREREWEDLVDQVGTDGRIRVWHIVNGKSIWAGEMTTDGFSLDALMDTYGGGDKSLAFYQGRTKVDTLRVSLDPSVPLRNPRYPNGTTAPAAAAPAPGTDLTSIIAAMSAMMAASAANSSEMLRGVVTMMTARPQEKDPLELVTKVLEITKQPPSTTPAVELFTVFKEGMALANNMKGDDDGTLAIAREGLGVVAKIVENQGKATAAAAGPNGRRTLPSGHEASGPSRADVGPHVHGPLPVDASGAGSGGNASGTPQGEVVMAPTRRWVDAARPASGLLLLALGNFQPDTVASMIADRLDEDAFSDLITDIEQGTPGEFLDRFRGYFALEPFDDNSARWMLDLVQCVKALVEDGEDLPPENTAA